MPSSYSTFHPPNTYSSKNLSISVSAPSHRPKPPPQPFKPSFTPIVQPRELPRQRLPESFNLVTHLPAAFSLRTDSVSLYRARMENRNVVLRVLNGEMVKPEFSELSISFAGLSHRTFAATFFLYTLIFTVYRLCWCHRKTQLPGFCILPRPARSPSLPARTSWSGLPASSSGYSCGGAGEQRPAQLPVEMPTGRKCEVYFYRGYTTPMCVNSNIKPYNWSKKGIQMTKYNFFLCLLLRNPWILHVRWLREEYSPWPNRWPQPWSAC